MSSRLFKLYTHTHKYLVELHKCCAVEMFWRCDTRFSTSLQYQAFPFSSPHIPPIYRYISAKIFSAKIVIRKFEIESFSFAFYHFPVSHLNFLHIFSSTFFLWIVNEYIWVPTHARRAISLLCKKKWFLR